jgi:hypothetical protein
MNLLDQITDQATHPAVAVPVVTTAGAANTFIDHLPILINLGMVLYVVLLVGHKGWTWYTEYKDRRGRKE